MTASERNRRRRRHHPSGPQVGAASPSAVPTTSTTSTGAADGAASPVGTVMSSPTKNRNRNNRMKVPNYREAAIEVAAFVSDKNDVVSRTVRGILETNGVGRREAAANRYLKNALGIRTSNNANAAAKIPPADASDHPFQRSFRAKLREATDATVVQMLMAEARQQSMPELIAVAERKLRLLQNQVASC